MMGVLIMTKETSGIEKIRCTVSLNLCYFAKKCA